MADIRDFLLPDLGEGLEEGEIVSWAVEVGERITLNQTVAEIETAKAVVAVPSPFAGVVKERHGEVGDVREVGKPLITIEVEAVAKDAPGDDLGGQSGGSPAQGAMEATPTEAAGSAPSSAAKNVEDTSGLYGEVQDGPRKSTGLDADEEPQPLVGYGQGGGGGRRRRRGKGAPQDQPPAEQPAETAGQVKPLAKPPVRKLAKDLGVDLAEIAPGSGQDGVITREDVRAAADGGTAQQPAAQQPAQQQPAAKQPTAQPAASAPALVSAAAGEKPVPGFRGRTPGEVEQVKGIRKRIIAKMEQSRREIPHALCSRDADLTELWELRHDLTAEARSQGFDVKITPNALIMRATVLALRRFPTLNAVYDEEAGEIRLLEHINLGVAVDTDRGLIVPNIKDAHTKSTLQLAMETVELAEKCRTGTATPGELTGGTFTVDNYGFFGNDDGNPIINAPEAGILGIGAIRERPWVHEGEIAVRRVTRFQLAFDHRICDGGEAGRF
ncbi:MAG: 2-oxo acid dehydrogenase subunit E2, partial [Actinobacteria bacterium]|nr:2-oxo acid dehydrogenase subunit E2 [Actinomycetota bacterium]